MESAVVSVGSVIYHGPYKRKVVAIVGDAIYAKDEFGMVYKMDLIEIRRNWKHG